MSRSAGQEVDSRGLRAPRRWLIAFALFGLILPLVAVGTADDGGAEDIRENAQDEGEKTSAGNADVADPWAPFRLLEGSWEGAIDGRLGQGTAKRRYEFILDGLYLTQRHASVRLPQEESPKGDYHRELSVFSLDRGRGTIVMRSFMVEGFVLQSTCQTEPMRFVCASEAIENGSGMRSRLTVEIEDRYRFKETFELASPGQELEVFFTNTWTRVPDLAD